MGFLFWAIESKRNLGFRGISRHSSLAKIAGTDWKFLFKKNRLWSHLFFKNLPKYEQKKVPHLLKMLNRRILETVVLDRKYLPGILSMSLKSV